MEISQDVFKQHVQYVAVSLGARRGQAVVVLPAGHTRPMQTRGKAAVFYLEFRNISIYLQEKKKIPSDLTCRSAAKPVSGLGEERRREPEWDLARQEAPNISKPNRISCLQCLRIISTSWSWNTSLMPFFFPSHLKSNAERKTHYQDLR